MENPSETQQRRLIRRVTNNVERLNEVVVQINKEFENIQPNLKQVKSEISAIRNYWARTQKNIDHTFTKGDGAHEWSYWVNSLPTVLNEYSKLLLKN